MALFSNAKEEKTVKRASYQTGLLAAQDLEAVSLEKARAQAGEESALSIWNRLGSAGSFDTPTTPGTMAPTDIYDTTGPLSKKDPAAIGLLSPYSAVQKDKNGVPIGVNLKRSPFGTGAQTMFDPRQGILDPEKYANYVGQSAQFRIQSMQTAEAEQLLKQQGPAWDMLNNSTIGKIYEGAAISNREALRSIRDNLAKGGSARRVAFAQAQELIQIEKAHQMRTQQTWNANLALDAYIRQNADRVQESNIRFLDNLPELRQTYADTMRTLTNMLTGQVVPGASSAINQASAAVTAVQAKDNAFLEGLIQSGVTAVIGAAVGAGSNAFGGGGTPGEGEYTSNGSNITTAIASMMPNKSNIPFFQPSGAAYNPSPNTNSWQSLGLGALRGAGQSLFGSK